jgi:2-haloacid dehalogenase
MYKAIIFDLDDTLLDFRASEAHSLGLVHREMLDGLVDFAAFTDVFRKVNKVLWRDLEKALVTPQEIKYLRFQRSLDAFSLKVSHHDAAARYEEALSQSAIWFDGVQDAFKRLHTTHRLGLITNGISRIQRSRVKLAGIADMAHSIVVSEEVARCFCRA